MIKYIPKGNIFELEVQSYAHGCNCSGVMGKGIALQFKQRFPKMYLEYKSLCKNHLFNLGDVFVYKIDGCVIYNLATQHSWKTKADLQAIKESLSKMLNHATQNKIATIGLPRIGAGLGGLDWDDIKEVLSSTGILFPQVQLIIVEEFDNLQS